jgi:hypothetical protein
MSPLPSNIGRIGGMKPFQFSLTRMLWLMLPLSVVGWAIHWSSKGHGAISWVVVGVTFAVATTWLAATEGWKGLYYGIMLSTWIAIFWIAMVEFIARK